jgi:hypothetical protein
MQQYSGLKKTTNDIYKYFVGNKSNFIIWIEDVWKRNFNPISLNTLIKHLRHDIAIGSYPLYVEDGITYCKWICIDVDSHERVSAQIRKEVRDEYDEKTTKLILLKLEKEYKKRVDQELKKKQKVYAEYLFEQRSIIFSANLGFIVEDSIGGYHIWILLKDKTTLEDAAKFIYWFRPHILKLYNSMVGEGDPPEIYPKQYKIDHLHKKIGNAVRLPLGYNFGKQGKSSIIRGSIDSVEQLNISSIVYDLPTPPEQTNGHVSKCPELDEYDPQAVCNDLEFWLEFPLIKPCVKRIINGITQCYGDHGHTMRMAAVHECSFYNMRKETIYKIFEKQYDYDDQITTVQVESVLKTSSRRDGRYSCRKIKEIGYCHECNYD